MTTIKVVVFDCDGVMFDTQEANMAYYNDILTHFGRPSMTCEQFSYSYMHTAEKSLDYLIADPEVRKNALPCGIARPWTTRLLSNRCG